MNQLFEQVAHVAENLDPSRILGLEQEEQIVCETTVGGETTLLTFPKIISAQSSAAQAGQAVKGFGNLTNMLGFMDKTLSGLGDSKEKEEPLIAHRLEVMIETTDMDGAGTTAATYLFFIGDKSTEGPIHLTASLLSKNHKRTGKWRPFQEGSKDVFGFEVTVGKLQKIIVGKDQTNDSWHVLKVTVMDKWDGRLYYFPCEQWLTTKRKGLGNEVLLHAWPEDITHLDRRVTYKVVICTANNPQASCVANAFVAIYGDKGSTGKKWLGPKRSFLKIITSTEQSLLSKGQTVAFLINSFDVGNIRRIRIGHDNKGLGDARWKLDWVKIEKHTPSEDPDSTSAGPKYKFSYGQWLGYGGDDGLCEVTIYPDKERAHHRRRSDDQPDEPILLPMMSFTQRALAQTQATNEEQEKQSDAGDQPLKWRYKMLINTSDEPGADYDKDACVEVYGSTNKTPLFQLQGPFKKGQPKEFEDFGPDIGRVEELMLYAKQFGDGWHLQNIYLEVFDEKGQKKGAYTFNCDRWINTFGTPKSVLLLAHDVSKGQRTQYKIVTYTSDDPGAETRDNVYIQLQGKEGKSRMMHLKTSTRAFRSGVVSQFFRTTVAIGPLRTIVVAIDGKKTGTWKLEQIEVIDMQRDEIYMFPFNDWLRVPTERRDGEKQWCKQTLRVVQINPNAINQGNLKCRYKVVFHTADIDNADTRSSVSCVFYGDQGESGKITVKGGSKRFNKGQIDCTFFEIPNIGDIYKMRLSLEANAPTAWTCIYVHICNLRTGVQAVFLPDGCLATTTGTEKFKLIFAAGKSVPSTVVNYKVVVATGYSNETNISSLDTDVSIEVQGSLKTSTFSLEPATDEIAFDKGSLDVFHIESPKVGAIESAVISFKSRRSRGKWDLQYVEIIDPFVGSSVNTFGGGSVPGANEYLSQLMGGSVYLENPYGMIDATERAKRRIKRASYPQGFKTLEERLEEARAIEAGQKKAPTKDKGDKKDGGPSVPKPNKFALLRMLS